MKQRIFGWISVLIGVVLALATVEVAAWLRQTGAWVRQHANGARQPLLPSIKLGKKRVFRRADIEEFLAKWSVAP